MHLTLIDCTAVLTLPVWHKAHQPIFTEELVWGFPPGLVIKTSGCACLLLQGGWGRGRAVAAPFLPNRQQSWSGLQENTYPSREYGFRKIISWGFYYSSTSYHLTWLQSCGSLIPQRLWLLPSLWHCPFFEAAVGKVLPSRWVIVFTLWYSSGTSIINWSFVVRKQITAPEKDHVQRFMTLRIL